MRSQILWLISVLTLAIIIVACINHPPAPVQEAQQQQAHQASATVPPTSEPAATRPARISLEQVLGPANLTDAQQAEVKRVVDEETGRWDAWRREHQADSDQFDRDSKAALAAKDKETLQSLREARQAVNETMPRSREAWDRIKQALDEKQRAALGPDQEGIDALDHVLHHKVLQAMQPATDSPLVVPPRPQSKQCGVCHTPYYKL